jgi:hypothetical protein
MSNEPENSEDWFTSPIRTIRRELLFQRQLEGLAIHHRRIEEVLSGIEYGLAKHPELFAKVPGSRDCVVTTYVYHDAPSLRILFTYTATEVHLTAIEFADD